MSNLFLDANILLDFYRYGADDLTEIEKLVALIEDDEVILYSNSHLKNETQRMRERVLSDSFSELKATKHQVKAPNYTKKLPELAVLQQALKKANDAHSKLVEAVGKKIAKGNLDADVLIAGMFDKCKDLEITENIVKAARLRQDLGNPPGKQGAIGDSIHWETLLQEEKLKSIDIVSRDGDFESELEVGALKSFLSEEWSDRKPAYSRVTLFKSLSGYFKKRYPKIELSKETQKIELIEELRSSPNFASTHSIVAQLEPFEYFTRSQIHRMIEILCDNPQIGRIGTDADIRAFYSRFETDAYDLPEEVLAEAANLIGEKEEFFYFPF
ncbi:PIN domain-containing protein [Ruegeria atlantica]|uniref:PIN domain-containing protein n=1 Tax=Ruegeria atlantica TaxID=81569 RepID=UPI00147D2DF9